LEILGRLVEVEMLTVLQTKVRATGEHQREVGVAMTVTLGHAAAEERHRRAQERLAIDVIGLREPGEEVAQLLDGEGDGGGEWLHGFFHIGS